MNETRRTLDDELVADARLHLGRDERDSERSGDSTPLRLRRGDRAPRSAPVRNLSGEERADAEHGVAAVPRSALKHAVGANVPVRRDEKPHERLERSTELAELESALRARGDREQLASVVRENGGVDGALHDRLYHLGAFLALLLWLGRVALLAALLLRRLDGARHSDLRRPKERLKRLRFLHDEREAAEDVPRVRRRFEGAFEGRDLGRDVGCIANRLCDVDGAIPGVGAQREGARGEGTPRGCAEKRYQARDQQREERGLNLVVRHRAVHRLHEAARRGGIDEAEPLGLPLRELILERRSADVFRAALLERLERALQVEHL